MANRVFISFRNGDDPYAAALLFRALATHFGPGAVFRSSESIPPGAPWAETIWRHHARSAVLVAVIGPRWLDMRDGQGRLRLHREDDWVRREIAGALRQGKLVIPVVLDGIPQLDPGRLPGDVAPIAGLQAIRMDHRRIDAAVDALIERIAGVPGPGLPPSDLERLAMMLDDVPLAQAVAFAAGAPTGAARPRHVCSTRAQTRSGAAGFASWTARMPMRCARSVHSG